MGKYDLSSQKAKEMMVKKDKQRQSYYNYYSNKKWGSASSYDLCLNSSLVGIDGAADLIIDFIQKKEARNG